MAGGRGGGYGQILQVSNMRPFMDSVLLLDLKLGSHKGKKGKSFNTILLFDCSRVNMMLLCNISLEINFHNKFSKL